MNNKERVIILIDGSNFYHYAKELGFQLPIQFDYKGLGEKLADGRDIVSGTYYIGKVRAKEKDEHSQRLRSNQQRLMAWLARCGWSIEFGHMMKNQGIFHEKGVDVHIAADLLRGAYKDTYDTAILISSDTDLIPAIQYVREEGKKLEYVGFAHRPSYGLIKNSTLTKTLTKEGIGQFL
ncbi:MAG: hypothetical protein A3C02_03925 [Candidatus Andersenbacteria bacterium RIFCSPHIGHO2_02_FULL_45_11]|uniref:NYN domain-containing protein n=1 Tax=Candidatus Andersenbacteria bacterium RIFCSPHIGHO2_12_FULL_45_11 TaxID=1797281 RepID=A0A1G1WZZ1_9BACT|nr:MAG: hypothetical protein A2805_00645 [Candidatus Andersenbacteria bacterium RIFCSPHIGHO2_01_FULL_46_36]OGY33101.1 MAG: hypothetical protein A3D99_01430 [Candidatus Andersenbacteria bacterium RIFCSPHIGHO2_12_FULL_45_11]OGY33378.1 MAG: hypothetical protein A3C02_03925 [Candidatus Andersenbacteria bacterium RIFCSPHIGHO2_02_FULL_45_11]